MGFRNNHAHGASPEEHLKLKEKLDNMTVGASGIYLWNGEVTNKSISYQQKWLQDVKAEELKEKHRRCHKMFLNLNKWRQES